MKVEFFVEKIKELGIGSLIGVPDSTLKQFCDYVNSGADIGMEHFVPANEGAATGMAVGVYLATGKPACVYMQNSGLGNVVNPLTSIANEEVYDIPMLFITGYRGEPGIKDEPQHKFMGKITTSMYELLGVEYAVIGKETSDDEVCDIFLKAKELLSNNKQFALIIKKDTFEKKSFGSYENGYTLVREEVIGEIVRTLEPEDVVISTTGKISREVYEQSDIILGNHSQDFLTVGGMGHASMIAYGYAVNRPKKRVYCIDGDGAVLMHMGSLAFIGSNKVDNLVHICINNGAHESVGGMPTGASEARFSDVAKACGYDNVYCIEDMEALKQCLMEVKSNNSLAFIEVMVAMKSREDLGRPKETAVENKKSFMEYHG